MLINIQIHTKIASVELLIHITSYTHLKDNWNKKLPGIDTVTEELCIEITQNNAKVHLCDSKKDRHLHLQRVKEW